MNTNGLTAPELQRFANTLAVLDAEGLQVDGEVFISEVGSMRVTFDGLAGRNVVVAVEGIE